MLIQRKNNVTNKLRIKRPSLLLPILNETKIHLDQKKTHKCNKGKKEKEL